MKHTSSDATRLLTQQVAAWDLALTWEQMDQLVRYTELLSSYERANIIGVRDFDSIVLDHLLDSLSCLLFEPLKTAGSLVDVGSGAGLPGIPLKIAVPSIRMSLIEATLKKAVFLRFAIQKLQLHGAEVVNARAEDSGRRPRYRESYAVAAARAVAPLPILAEYCLPLVTVGGHVVCMKGRPTEEELREGKSAARLLGARISKIIPVPLLPEVRIRDRCLVILEKTYATPKRFPRKPGQAKKHPLGTPTNIT